MTPEKQEKLSRIFESLTYMMISLLIVVVVSFGLLLIYTKVASAEMIDDFETYELGNFYEQDSDWIFHIATSGEIIGNNSLTNIQSLSFEQETNGDYRIQKYVATTTSGIYCMGIYAEEKFSSFHQTSIFDLRYGSNMYAGFAVADNSWQLKFRYNNTTNTQSLYLNESKWNELCIEYGGTTVRFYVNGLWSDTKTTNYPGFDNIQFDLTHKKMDVDTLTFDISDLFQGGEVVELPDTNLSISIIDFDMIESVNSQICFFNEPCYLWFSYTPDLIGEKIYAVPDVQFEQNPYYQVASTTIVEIPGNPQNALVLPEYLEATTTPLCLYLDYNGGFLYCGISVTYMDRDIWWDNAMDRIGATTTSRAEMIANACSDLTAPTSTSIFLSAISIDWWLYTLRCSFQKTIVWAFEPSQEAYGAFYNNLSVMTQGFPLNIATGLYREVSTNRQATSTINLLAISDSTGQVVNYLVRSDLIEATDTYGIIPWIRQLCVFALQIFLVMYFIWRLLFNRKTNDN